MKKSHASVFVVFIFLISFTTIIYRFAANSRYLPYLFGAESKQSFLMKNLNFAFGDFYDENNDIKKIAGNSEVLILNSHNLYYIPFSFVHETWKTDKVYEFIAVQDAALPMQYQGYKEIYKNPRTRVTLYKSYK